MVLKNLDIQVQKKKNPQLLLIQDYKKSFKLDHRSKNKCKLIQHLEEKHRGENPYEIGNGQIDKLLYYVKIINFCSLKDTLKKMKRQTSNQEKIFVKCISEK